MRQLLLLPSADALEKAQARAVREGADPDWVDRMDGGRLNCGSGRNVIGDNGFLQMETRGADSEINRYIEESRPRQICMM